MDNKDFLKYSEVAQRLSVSRSSVVRLVQAGKLKSIKIGDSVRIPMKEYQKFVKALTYALD